MAQVLLLNAVAASSPSPHFQRIDLVGTKVRHADLKVTYFPVEGMDGTGWVITFLEQVRCEYATGCCQPLCLHQYIDCHWAGTILLESNWFSASFARVEIIQTGNIIRSYKYCLLHCPFVFSTDDQQVVKMIGFGWNVVAGSNILGMVGTVIQAQLFSSVESFQYIQYFQYFKYFQYFGDGWHVGPSTVALIGWAIHLWRAELIIARTHLDTHT